MIIKVDIGTVDVDVFEDPEYCCEKLLSMQKLPDDRCQNLTNSGQCEFFSTGHPENYLFMTDHPKFRKCEECKEAIKKYKESDNRINRQPRTISSSL